MLKHLLLFNLLLTISASSFSQVVINEVLADNGSYVFDPETEDYPDFIELYNAGDEAVDISSYSITDDIENADKWKFPQGTIVEAGGVIVIWADESKIEGLHANFKLSKKGEYLMLSDAQGVTVDELRFPPQFAQISFGQQPDGSGNWTYFKEPTAGKLNLAPPVTVLPLQPEIDQVSGFYSEPVSLRFSSSESEEIRYTLDGSDPVATSPLYESPITLKKTTVVKAACFNEVGSSSVVTRSFFVNDREFDLPVVSIIVEPDHFFSNKTGIYVEGSNGIVGNCMDSPVNWNQDWERPIRFEYFSPQGELLVDKPAEARIMGGCSRLHSQKSLTIVAKDGRFNYPFFKSKPITSYNSIVLRNSGNDWATQVSSYEWATGTMMADAFMQELLKDEVDLDCQAYQPVAVFINGKYWGLHNMREHLNNKYIENNHPKVDANNIDLIKNYWDVKDGDSEALSKLQVFLLANDLSDSAAYAEACRLVDVNEFINYQIAQIYYANYDWPGNNIRMWRERNDEGKWRFMLYDTDFGYGITGENPQTNSLEFALEPNGPDWPNPPHSTLLFRKLLENEKFKELFIQRFMVMIHSTFATGRADSILYAMKDAIKTEMDYHIQRWHHADDPNVPWATLIDRMSYWGRNRQKAMQDVLKEYFDLDTPVAVNLSLSVEKSATLFAAGKRLANAENRVESFKGLHLNVRVVPEDGYRFSHWEDASGKILSEQTMLDLVLEDSAGFIAVMEERPIPSGLSINEILTDNRKLVFNSSGASPDFVEIYNAGPDTADLSGLYLSDDSLNLKKFKLPFDSNLQISPGGYFVFWADGKPEDGACHLGWKLAKEGGSVFLSFVKNGQLTVADKLVYGAQPENYSYGLREDGPEFENQFPTPGRENQSLESVARLYALSAERLPLCPKFHPDSFQYEIFVPEGFSHDVKLNAESYGNASFSISDASESGLITIEVESADELSAETYSVAVKDYVDVSNYLNSVTVTGGSTSETFHYATQTYIIHSASEAVPVLNWLAASDDASVVYLPAESLDGESKLVVISPNRGERVYTFSFTTEDLGVQGYTEDFSDANVPWYLPPTSFTATIGDGAADVIINKTSPWDGIWMDLDVESLNLQNYPYVQLELESTVDCRLRVDLYDVDEISTNGAPVLKEIKAGEPQIVDFDFTGCFFQTWPEDAVVDSKNIGNLWLCFDPDQVGLKGEVRIKSIKVGKDVQFASDKPAGLEVYLSDGEISPAFDDEVFNYVVRNFESLPRLFATLADTDAELQVIQFNSDSDRAEVVVQQAGDINKTYSFKLLEQGQSAEAYIASVSIENGSLSPEFEKGLFHYLIAEDSQNLSAVTPLQYVGESYILYPANSKYQDSYVIVYAENGTKKIYGFSHDVPEEEEPVKVSEKSGTVSFTVFPNPMRNHAWLKFGEHVKNGTLEVYNLLGENVFALPVEGESVLMSRGELSSGVYNLVLKVQNEVHARQKLIVN